jgi:hypothetical protein
VLAKVCLNRRCMLVQFTLRLVKFYLFQRLDATLLIFPQVCAQCICRYSCYAAYLVMAQSQALQPKGVHFTLNSGMGIMISLVLQCLHRFFREFYPDHLYHLVDFIAQTKRCLTICKNMHDGSATKKRDF